MPQSDTPSLPAIRERVQAWQAQRAAVPKAPWPDRLVGELLADALALLEENERLRAQAADLRAALTHVWERGQIGAASGWGPDTLRDVLGEIEGAARAALGEAE